ncbi:hypothetical protein NITMOv2_2045 [Nitrospira moscoviensis]|uniref:Uncharacterized protein n=1 Tax=Nitrospira moscoviensis TaxID=42253 RepID=A0A0K2GCZ8_NITMO|nr:hypothetical protein NITMOv2_2045 [Nitrospira moscoviensis]
MMENAASSKGLGPALNKPRKMVPGAFFRPLFPAWFEGSADWNLLLYSKGGRAQASRGVICSTSSTRSSSKRRTTLPSLGFSPQILRASAGSATP